MASLLGTILADFTTQLATEISVGGTTATLSSATDDDGVALPAGRYFFTIDGANSSKEHISCTLSGTSLTSIKSVSRQGVETSGVARKHRIGASVTITDFAHILQINNLLNGTTNLNASTPLEYHGTATISSANQLATKDYVDGVAIAGSPDASTTVKGISKLSTAPVSASNPIAVGDNDGRVPTQSENDALVGTSGTPSSSNKYVTNDDTSAISSANKVVRQNSNGKLNNVLFNNGFGGTGADGALSITSGTTNIDLGNARQVIKNYTSISITGTGALTFTNPHASGTIIVLKSQGDVTITSSATRAIDVRNLGAGPATNGTSYSVRPTTGTTGSSGIAGSGGTGHKNGDVGICNKSIFISTGAGGASGQAGGNSVAGSGGGALYIECGGAYNCTGTLDASGQNATNNTTSPGGSIAYFSAGGGGGKEDGGGGTFGNGNSYGNAGGGGGGCIVVLYGSLTTDSGTYTVNGGTATGSGSGVTGGTGGAGFSFRALNTEFV